MSILWSILIGIAAGGIAGWLTKGGGFGIVVNLIVGLVGGMLGGWIYGMLGFGTHSIIGTLLVSVAGAVLLLWIVSFFLKKYKQSK